MEKILAEIPSPSPQYLEILANYLVLCMEKKEKKEKVLLTENRMTTINKREQSFEGLVDKMENGEDGIYNLINNSKNQIFHKKISISKKDLADIPELSQLKDSINEWERLLKCTSGKKAYIIKKALIEMRKDQYLIKMAYKKPIIGTKIIKTSVPIPLLDNTSKLNHRGLPIPKGISLLNPKICSAILCNYSALKQDSYDFFNSDLYFLLLAFDEISEKALKEHPIFEKIVEYKIDGLSNKDIQDKIEAEFGVRHSPEHISSLWRKKIPRLIASAAEDQWLYNYYLNAEKGTYKKCGRCGEIKLAHNKYFSRNRGSRDGFYSICKKCRNSKKNEKNGGV